MFNTGQGLFLFIVLAHCVCNRILWQNKLWEKIPEASLIAFGNVLYSSPIPLFYMSHLTLSDLNACWLTSVCVFKGSRGTNALLNVPWLTQYYSVLLTGRFTMDQQMLPGGNVNEWQEVRLKGGHLILCSTVGRVRGWRIRTGNGIMGKRKRSYQYAKKEQRTRRWNEGDTSVLGELCCFVIVSQQLTIKPVFKREVCYCFSKGTIVLVTPPTSHP